MHSVSTRDRIFQDMIMSVHHADQGNTDFQMNCFMALPQCQKNNIVASKNSIQATTKWKGTISISCFQFVTKGIFVARNKNKRMSDHSMVIMWIVLTSPQKEWNITTKNNEMNTWYFIYSFYLSLEPKSLAQAGYSLVIFVSW